MSVYGYNDWRYYQQATLRHSWGKSPEMKAKEKEYNADYYQKHKEEILKKAKERSRNSDAEYNEQRVKEGRDFDESRDELLRWAQDDGELYVMSEEDEGFRKYYEELNSKHTEYDDDVLKNISKNNQAVIDNIKNLTKTVQEYVKNNGSKLSDADIKKLYKDLDHQIALEEKRMINLDTKEGKAYVDDLLKSGGSSSSKSSGSSNKKKITAANASPAKKAPNAQSELGMNGSRTNSPIQRQLQERQRQEEEEERRRRASGATSH